MSADIKLNGFSELAELLRQLPVEVGPQKILKKALFNSAAPIETDAKARCPVDTGSLRESISRQMGRVSMEKDLSTEEFAAVVLCGTVSGGSKAAVKKREKLGIENDPYYGRYVELGTRFEKPQPFLGPAFDMQTPNVLNELSNELGEAIDQVWTKDSARAT